MAINLTAAPALSTPSEHLFEHVDPEVAAELNESQIHKRSDDELREIYEIASTACQIRAARQRRIALQFPDSMLGDSPWVAEALNGTTADQSERIYILADTSYSSCCVDEIAAEHVDADVVVHYGRACLSPTSRLPVVYVFTKHPLDEKNALEAFESDFQDKQSKVILMADVTYQNYVASLASQLRGRGYTELLSTTIAHNPAGQIPNRTVLAPDETALSDGVDLQSYSVFHISTPPTSLLLVLSSRVQSLHILPTNASSEKTLPTTTISSAMTARRLLGRRYARLLSVATAGIIGILVNTLSVSNYLSSVDSIRKQIAAAGKKSYTIVVGKLNPAKLANFAEVDGWVVVGCWESSLVEDDAGFYKPVITPFELGVALAGDDKRTWSGEWWGGIEGVQEYRPAEEDSVATAEGGIAAGVDEADDTDEEESAPPEFDLRTGRLISHSRPMRVTRRVPKQGDDSIGQGSEAKSAALALRPKAELATVNGVISPGAEFLRSQRTWQGLGSDFDNTDTNTTIEEGRRGVARGYTVGSDGSRK
ncbi:diphthamide biosynthesis protein 2 [Coniochaeta ligniaria NRRL 30616]|uniref:2-(3-amino-3-carboxypropyl)histidine synthase subunit 2 n=1 Tax=Coniochaeta ligniaria NRRL 30616 TaxID=1408157 RepID=A0A1J7JFT8_9PEZI|nr:diphthamide biosynthesis protein 2 [Coniochaeta ligniaria NRRL 30616]